MPRQYRHKPRIQANARESRRSQTSPERRLWNHLREKQLGGLRFRRQHPIGSFIVDFYCPEHRLIVELDGYSHRLQPEYDERRAQALLAQGYRLLRFANRDLRDNLEGVLAAILQAAQPD